MQRHDTRLDPTWDLNKRRNDPDLLESLIGTADLSPAARAAIVRRAVGYVQAVRSGARPGLMEAFLAEYGLSSDEGVALMCLAEALLRIPDARTIDALIEDKIAGSDWSEHLGQSGSLLVNSSTLGLLLAGQVLSARTNSGADAVADTLQGLARRMGTPAIRAAVSTVIKQMGRQFVLGESIQAAMARAAREEAQGFTFSYDMLGEAALTAADADRFRTAYQHAIAAIAARCTAGAVADNPGISIKLSALHPRYEVAQADRVLAELVPVVVDLARRAAAAGMGLNIDAEEADRLGLSLAVIRAVLADPALSGWDGFGVVVQGYGRRAGDVIDGLYAMAVALDRRLMVRLVKGAYWDTEIKHAQVEGLDGYPVFTQKPASDVSFIALSRRLLGMTDRLYPQFATHNAHSVAAILEMAATVGTNHYEFQRLHGMGEALYRHLVASEGVRCRVYAPVGAHRELLAYLVRRLLENGANSSFVNQIVDDRIAPEDIVACPFDRLAGLRRRQSPPIPLAPDLFQPERPNARGWDLSDVTTLADIDARRRRPDWLTVEPLLAPNAVAEEKRQRRYPPRSTTRRRAPASVRFAPQRPPKSTGRWPLPGPGLLPPASVQRSLTGSQTSMSSTSIRPFRCWRPRRARPYPTPSPSFVKRWISCATTPPGPKNAPGTRHRAGPLSASARGTSRWPSSPGRLRLHWLRATRCWPSRPRRRPRLPPGQPD